MIDAKQIPPEVVEAAADELRSYFDTTHTQAFLREMSRASIVAALNAWPGARVDDTYRWLSDVAIILPMEDKNAKS